MSDEQWQKVQEQLEALAERHKEAHLKETKPEMIEWHRGMWEAYEHASGIVSRRGESGGDL